jgi:MOSC domain-containing protein YiiM
LENSAAQEIDQYGFKEDEQADRRVHGGVDKAIYAYPEENYPFWAEILQREVRHGTLFPLQFGLVGENLTTQGLTEETVFVADQWRIGEVLCQVTQFREPCFKLNLKMQYSGAAKAMLQSAKSGWYLKVLEGGSLRAGDQIQVIPGRRELSIAQQNRDFLNQRGQLDIEPDPY